MEIKSCPPGVNSDAFQQYANDKYLTRPAILNLDGAVLGKTIEKQIEWAFQPALKILLELKREQEES